MKTLLSMLLTVSLFLTGCEKARIDQQVKELCAKDGGVRVYETVKLPPDRFDQWGILKTYNPTKNENALGPDYIYKWERQYIHRGEPTLNPEELAAARDWIQIVRKSDKKVLGEVVRYYRAGGDLPGPWMPSSYECPPAKDANVTALMTQIFVIETNGDRR